MARRLLGLVFLLLLSGCRLADVAEYCVDNPGGCPPCESDDECRFVGNPCQEVTYCAHREAGVVTIDIGCSEALEYSWPDDDECYCDVGTCLWGVWRR